MPFNHPVYILFSSGTTGVPKCIVHGGGGTLLQHLKEHRLQSDVRDGDRVFYFTTLGWMMWNWLVSGIGAGATLILWDGSPFAPKPDVLFDYAQDEKITLFGTIAKYIDALKKADVHPATHARSVVGAGDDLDRLAARGGELRLRLFRHQEGPASRLDLGRHRYRVLLRPRRPDRARVSRARFKLRVSAWRSMSGPTTASISTQEKGELVCTRPFTSMPVMFWNDPEGKKYHAAYFERFPNIWCHGDFAEWTKHGGLIIHGRSDATLNPGGVRIGTAEIYAQVEQIPEVIEAIAIGQDFDNDVRVILFVRCKDGVTLDDALRETIKKKIRIGASPRHVPAKIIQIADIPRTKSGKITELAVRDVVHGRPVKNTEALANPEALKLYERLQELRS